MLKIGLTGGMGSGKSTAAEIFRGENIPVIDADAISREVLELYPEIMEKIRAAFGEQFFDEENKLNRKKLGSHVFQSKEKREKLESLIMPYIFNEIFRRIQLCNDAGEAVCIVDAPVLIEQGLHKFMDKNILVWATEENQIQRVLKRDSLSEDDIKARLAAQMPFSEKKKYVDYIIDNNESLERTKEQIQKTLEEIKELEKNSAR